MVDVNNTDATDISKIIIDKDDIYKMFSKEQYRDYVLQLVEELEEERIWRGAAHGWYDLYCEFEHTTKIKNFGLPIEKWCLTEK